MDGNVQRPPGRSSSLPRSPTNDDGESDQSDTISLTSTVESVDPPDTEYVVEGVHAEREQEIDGQIRPVYLVEWANFPLDQCTWEPLENLPPELTKQWEEKKATQDPSVALEFEAKYTAAFNAKLEEARQRHRQRNAKRRRLGYQPTPFWFRNQPQSDSENEPESADEALDSEHERFTPSSGSDNECREAGEDNAVGHKAMEALELSKSSSSKAMLPKTPRPPSRVFTFDPDKAKKPANTKSREAPLSESPRTPTLSNSARQPQNSHASKGLSDSREISLTSADQGSARKPDTAESSSSLSASAILTRTAAVASAAMSSRVSTSIPPATRTTSEVAKKPLTGRKTPRSNMPIDIFSGGKKSKQRQGVGEAEIDSNRTPKIYQQANYRRKSELRSRARSDQAPDISKIANIVFAPGSNAGFLHSAPQGQASIEADDIQGTTPNEVPRAVEEQSSTATPKRSGRASGVTENTRYAGAPKRSSLSLGATEADRPNKKGKRVHFTEVEAGPSVSYGSSAVGTRSERFPQADDKYPCEERSFKITEEEGLFVDEPMDIYGTSGVSSDQPDDTSSSSAAGVRKLSLSTYISRNGNHLQSVNKKIKLSTSSESILDVTFDALPKATSTGPAQQWLNDFLNTGCLEIGHMVLAATFIAQLPSLESQSFQRLCSGAVTSTSSSVDLDVLAEHLRVGSSGLFVAQAHFNLLIFPTKCADFDGLSEFGVEPVSPGGVALKYFMFASALPIFQQIRPSSSPIQGLETRVSKEKVVLFPTILGLQYSAIIASADKKTKPAHFFLAFPQRAIEWQRSIASWLSTREKTCKIYTNFDSGSWLAFVEKAKRERGIVMVHEALVPFLRRFPQLAKLLVKYPVNVWHFSESLDLGPPQPLVGSAIVPAMSTKLSRLFPFGSVILVTPSFVVSEPQAAFRLLKWFYEGRAKQSNYKLVVAYNFLEYLNELSLEKSALRSKLQNELWSRKDPPGIAKDKNKAALTDQDLEARQKTCIYMGWWLSEQVHGEAPFSDFNPTIVADRSIDPHDEQSLVNWFGWWSMAHSHEYRKFYVVGSSSKTDSAVGHTLTSRTSRKISLAKYSPSVVNDPDEAMRISLSQRGSPNTVDSVFQSQWFQNDENRIGLLLQAQDRSRSCKLYHSPVSWVDKTMAVHYGDPGMSFKTIEQWWDSIFPWISGSHHYNTFVGFFYTISRQWDPDKSPQSIKPRRQPWLAIWRPVDPHEKGTMYSHGRTELIIWDVRARAEFETRASLQLEDLTWMQQMLVKHIQLHAHEKNPNSFLEKVWLGGFQAHQSSQWTEPADITAEFLVRLVDNLKQTLAASARYLSQSGYRRVDLRMGPSDKCNEEQSVLDPDTDTRIIFHAPRGSETLQPKGVSKCINDLFEATKEARLRFKNAKTMIYTYPPTLFWYQKQVDEGRHFEHILVDEWDKIFSVLGIVDKSTSAPMSASGDGATSASLRKGSGSSTHSSAPYETPVA